MVITLGSGIFTIIANINIVSIKYVIYLLALKRPLKVAALRSIFIIPLVVKRKSIKIVFIILGN